MVPASILSTAIGTAAVLTDDRLIRLNRKMAMADFDEKNPFVSLLTARLGEHAGWTALQVLGIGAFGAMALVAFLYSWVGWVAVGISALGLLVVSFGLLHDGREMRLATKGARKTRPSPR